MKKVTFTPDQVKDLEKKHKCKLIHVIVFFDDKRDLDPEKRDRADMLIKDPLEEDNLQKMTALIDIKNNVSRAEYLIDNCFVEGDDCFRLNAQGKANNTKARYTGGMQAINAIDTLDGAVVKH